MNCLRGAARGALAARRDGGVRDRDRDDEDEDDDDSLDDRRRLRRALLPCAA